MNNTLFESALIPFCVRVRSMKRKYLCFCGCCCIMLIYQQKNKQHQKRHIIHKPKWRHILKQIQMIHFKISYRRLDKAKRKESDSFHKPTQKPYYNQRNVITWRVSLSKMQKILGKISIDWICKCKKKRHWMDGIPSHKCEQHGNTFEKEWNCKGALK